MYRRTPFRCFLPLALIVSVAAAQPPTISALVKDVPEGDTLILEVEGREETVRLFGVDCPEKGQPFADQSREAAKKAAESKLVVVERKRAAGIARVLVYLPSGTVLNHQLVRDGWCWWDREAAPQEEILKVLQEQASSRRTGLWQDDRPTAPWMFREQRK